MSETRKIAAILVADIVGHSRLAGADEDRALARLRAHTRRLAQGRSPRMTAAARRLAAEDAGTQSVQAAEFRLISEAPHHSFGHDLVGQTWMLDLP